MRHGLAMGGTKVTGCKPEGEAIECVARQKGPQVIFGVAKPEMVLQKSMRSPADEVGKIGTSDSSLFKSRVSQLAD
jgi:hypothetical protein